MALLYATRALRNLKPSNEDQIRGIQIIENALKVPLYEHINLSDCFLSSLLTFCKITGTH